jgi:hypothetical protein
MSPEANPAGALQLCGQQGVKSGAVTRDNGKPVRQADAKVAHDVPHGDALERGGGRAYFLPVCTQSEIANVATRSIACDLPPTARDPRQSLNLAK